MARLQFDATSAKPPAPAAAAPVATDAAPASGTKDTVPITEPVASDAQPASGTKDTVPTTEPVAIDAQPASGTKDTAPATEAVPTSTDTVPTTEPAIPVATVPTFFNPKPNAYIVACMASPTMGWHTKISDMCLDRLATQYTPYFYMISSAEAGTGSRQPGQGREHYIMDVSMSLKLCIPPDGNPGALSLLAQPQPEASCRWKFEKAENNTYYIQNVLNPSVYVGLQTSEPVAKTLFVADLKQESPHYQFRLQLANKTDAEEDPEPEPFKCPVCSAAKTVAPSDPPASTTTDTTSSSGIVPNSSTAGTVPATDPASPIAAPASVTADTSSGAGPGAPSIPSASATTDGVPVAEPATTSMPSGSATTNTGPATEPVATHPAATSTIPATEPTVPSGPLDSATKDVGAPVDSAAPSVPVSSGMTDTMLSTNPAAPSVPPTQAPQGTFPAGGIKASASGLPPFIGYPPIIGKGLNQTEVPHIPQVPQIPQVGGGRLNQTQVPQVPQVPQVSGSRPPQPQVPQAPQIPHVSQMGSGRRSPSPHRRH